MGNSREYRSRHPIGDWLMRQWEETIEELKREPLSEGVRDYLRNFFARKPAATPPVPAPAAPGAPVVPNPAVAQKFIGELNGILNRHQQALSSYIQTVNIKSLKRRLEEFDFRHIPTRPERAKAKENPALIPFPGSPAPAPGTPPTKKKKPTLPPNSIFNEAQSREWKPRIAGLQKVLEDVNKDVLEFLLKIARESGYTPKNPKDIRSVVSEMKNFTILDKKTLQILRIKLIGFMITYRGLEGWLKLFSRTQHAQQGAEKKAAKKAIP